METIIKYASKVAGRTDMQLDFVADDAATLTHQIIDFEDWWEEANETPLESCYQSYFIKDDRYQNAYNID